MLPVHANPSGGCILHRANPQYCKASLDPFRAFETTVRQQPVEANGDSLTEYVDPKQEYNERRPGKQVGHQSKKTK